METFSNLRETRKKKDKKFGVVKKTKKTIPERLIKDKKEDLFQSCNKCGITTMHERITYAASKRAIRCVYCLQVTLL